MYTFMVLSPIDWKLQHFRDFKFSRSRKIDGAVTSAKIDRDQKNFGFLVFALKHTSVPNFNKIRDLMVLFFIFFGPFVLELPWWRSHKDIRVYEENLPGGQISFLSQCSFIRSSYKWLCFRMFGIIIEDFIKWSL